MADVIEASGRNDECRVKHSDASAEREEKGILIKVYCLALEHEAQTTDFYIVFCCISIEEK